MRASGIVALSVLAVQAAWGAETAAFLDIGVGARALGMGGAYTAIGSEVEALHWNPAGLSGLEKREAAAGHVELFGGTRLDTLDYAHPTRWGTFAAGLAYLSQGRIAGRDSLGRPTAGFAASDAAASVGFARSLEAVELGGALKLVQSHIGSAEARTVVADIGARKKHGAVTIGGAARNLGPGLKFDERRNDLPLRLALGAGYAFAGGHAVALELVNGPRGAGTEFGLGCEYQAVRSFFLRAGYASRTAVSGGSGFEAARGLTLGVGLRGERLRVDYAATPAGELGSAHLFSVGARW